MLFIMHWMSNSFEKITRALVKFISPEQIMQCFVIESPFANYIFIVNVRLLLCADKLTVSAMER